MHYEKLLIKHKEFNKLEKRQEFYDEYMKHKDWRSWKGSVPVIEAMKLFGFVLSWDRYFEGDLGKFRQIYQEIYPIIQRLEGIRIEDADLSDQVLKRDIREVFDKVANCPKGKKGKVIYESTGASKILHTILPNLFVMWDKRIRNGILGESKDGKDYAYRFLPLMQNELWEAISSYMKDGLSKEEAVLRIPDACDKRTLPKLIDQYNYVIYTLGKQI